MTAPGKVLHEEILQPVTGRALPVMAGQTFSITLVEGPQCVDFNCFNLHDYREHMSVGHMRGGGFRPAKGSLIWSKPPRFSPMMAILDKPDTCVTDVLGARCHATLFEIRFGYPGTHTNCQDTLAEAIAEYGLTADDVHDSLNFWMNTGWDDSGAYFPSARRNPGRAGDTVELLALMDVLTVANTCGSGDISYTSNFWFHPIRLTVREATETTKRIASELNERHARYANQRRPEEFKVKPREEDRRCRKNPDYHPEFHNFPLRIHEYDLELTEADLANVGRLVRRGRGADQEDAIRSAIMAYCTSRLSTGSAASALDVEK